MALTSITKDFVVKSGALVEGTSFVTSSTAQTSTLQVNGGAAIAKNLIVGTTATIWGATTLQGPLVVNGYSQLQQLTATVFTATSANIIGISTFGGNTQFNGSLNTFSGALFVTGTNIFTVGTGAANFGGTVGIAGVTSITNNTTANSAGGTGALVVTGGTYIGDNLVVKSTAYNTATNTANAIYTPGGIYSDGGLTVGANGPVLFKGPVTFSGTATYVLSTNTYFTDAILEMHTPPGGVYAPWFLDDGKDVGFRFHYYTNSTDTNAALVLANDSKYLEWYSTGAESSGTAFTSATYGTFKTGAIKLAGGTQNQANTSTGDLTVLGGVGVGGSIYVAGIVTATTFVGALTGTATQANNLNGGASGSLPYQSNANVTTFLPIGTNGQILQITGGNPTWSNVSGLTAGLATTATNIAGGLADQIPYQSGPGQTVFNAALRFNGTTFTTTNVVVSGNTNSASYGANTGSLVVVGGAAVAQDLYVGGNINLNGSLFLKGVGLDQITGSTGTFDYVILEGTGTSLSVFDGSTFGGITTVTNTTPALGVAATAAFQVRGGVGISKDIYVSTTATVAGTLLATGTTPSLGVAAAGVIQASGGVGIAKDIYVGTTATVAGILYETNTAPTNGVAAAGAVQVTGGVGIAKDIYVGTTATVAGITYHNNVTPTLASATQGAVQTTGGVGIAKDIYVGTTATVAGILNETNTTPSLKSATAGAIVVSGGVGIAKDIYVGTTATIAGADGTFSTGTGALTVPFGGVGIGGGLVVAGVTSSTNTTPTLASATAGSIQTTGGVGIAKDIYVGTTATVAGTLLATGTTPSLGSATAGVIQATGGVGIAKDIYVGTTATVAGITYHNNTTPTLASATAGAVQTTGGVGIAKDLYVGTTATIAGILTINNNTSVNSTATGALILSGPTSGLGVGGGAVIGGTLTATNLVVTGSTTLPSQITLSNLTVTNLTITGTAPTLGSATQGALQVAGGVGIAKDIYVASTATFGSTISVSGIASFTNNTDSNSTSNGAVIVTGGVGIAKNLVVGTAVTVGSATTQTVVNAFYSNNSLYSSYTSGFIVTNAVINLDTWSASAYRTAKYLVQIVDGTKIHVEEILVFHDGTNVYMTEYAIATSQGELGTFDAGLATGTITLTFQANYTPTQMTIKMSRQTITL